MGGAGGGAWHLSEVGGQSHLAAVAERPDEAGVADEEFQAARGHRSKLLPQQLGAVVPARRPIKSRRPLKTTKDRDPTPVFFWSPFHGGERNE